MVITEGYRRIPKDTERYRKLPKATESRLENYRPSVSGVVANLELGVRLGSGAEPPAGSRLVGGQAPEAESFFVFGYPKLSFIGGSSAAGSPRLPESNYWSKFLPLWRDPFSGSGWQYL